MGRSYGAVCPRYVIREALQERAMPAMLSLGGPEGHRAHGALLQEANEDR